MPWVREVLLELPDAHWQAVPPRLEAALREFAQGWANTNLSENIFQHLRGKEAWADIAGRLGPKKAWSYATTSGLFDEWGRPQVVTFPEHRTAAPKQSFPGMTFIAPRMGSPSRRSTSRTAARRLGRAPGRSGSPTQCGTPC